MALIVGKKEISTNKFYYGFPIYLIGYKDEVFGFNFSTMSSSYSLGDMLVAGIYRHGNAINQIKKYREFTVNIPDKSLMEEIEIGGFVSSEDKFSIASKLEYIKSEKIDAPIIKNCPINIECEVIEIIESNEFENYSNIIAKVRGRLIDEELLKDGALDHEKFNSVIYIGDEYKRSYRYLNKDITELGSFFKD
ncbi:MAG: flavin reductase [Defluviitaleaceae bacterium]|nr:flavin reductase [Defluviitaleaceae bacterium]